MGKIIISALGAVLILFLGAGDSLASEELNRLNSLLKQYLTAQELEEAKKDVIRQIEGICETVRQEILKAGLHDPNCSVTHDFSDLPGFERLDETEIRFGLPLKGWNIRGNTSAKVADICLVPFWGGRCLLRTKIIARFIVDITDLRAIATVALAGSGNPADPRPQIKDYSVKLFYEVSVREDHDWPIRMLEHFLRPFMDPSSFLRNEVQKHLDAFAERIFSEIPLGSHLIGLPGIPLGLGGPGTPDASDVPLRHLEDLASSLEASLSNEFRPEMNILWESGDQVIWSGHLLAAEAFRYAGAGTRSEKEAAKAAAVKLVQGMSDLLDLGSVLQEGLLAKTMWRENTGRWGSGPRFVPARESGLGNPIFVNTIRGVTYAGESEPTTDQYLGFFLGQALAYELIDDEILRRQVRTNINRVVTNLQKSQFKLYITNDSADLGAIRAANPGKLYFTDTINGQTWLWSESFLKDFHRLLAAAAVHGYVNGNYGILNSYGPIARLSWFPVWIDTFETHRSYFKFNLDHGYLFLLSRYDTDQLRRSHYEKALSFLVAATGHHENVYFDLLRVFMGAANQEIMQRALNGLRLYTKRRAVDNLNDPAIEKIRYTPLSLTQVQAETIARYPLAAHHRSSYEGRDFIWQRSPFTLTEGVGGGPSAGIDFLLSYWMYRYAWPEAFRREPIPTPERKIEKPPVVQPAPEPGNAITQFLRETQEVIKQIISPLLPEPQEMPVENGEAKAIRKLKTPDNVIDLQPPPEVLEFLK